VGMSSNWKDISNYVWFDWETWKVYVDDGMVIGNIACGFSEKEALTQGQKSSKRLHSK